MESVQYCTLLLICMLIQKHLYNDYQAIIEGDYIQYVTLMI